MIGYRGTGKSTVARRLAAKLGWDSIDSDHEVERESGSSIASIFREQGEAHFRELEAQSISRLARLDQSVISLGGGAVLRDSTRELLRESGPVVLLTAAPETIAQRLQEDAATESQRPSLTGLGVVEEIEQVLAERDAVYHASADLVVDTAGKTPGDVAEEIVQRYGNLH